LEFSRRKNDIGKIKELSIKAKEIASIIANESKELFQKDEIVGEDFHKQRTQSMIGVNRLHL